jgi:V/A-type H+/Na+-transporting ATPase subunit E
VEILKTSETLEQQILEDARRKAGRVLEAAEKDARSISAQWQAKMGEDCARISAEAEAKISGLRQELESSLPLDFMRTRLAAAEEALRGSLGELFSALSPAELARVLGALLARASKAFGGQRVSVVCRGIGADAARGLVAAALPQAVIADVREESSAPAAVDGGAAPRGVIVATVDGRIRLRATLDELTSMLLEERREELVAALLGGEKAQ